MSTIQDSVFNCQDSPFDDLNSKEVQVIDQYFDKFDIAEKPIDFKLSKVSKGAVRTVYAIYLAQKPIAALELAELLECHRGTISAHARDLEAVAVIDFDIKKGTENHQNPTKLFKIDSSVDYRRLTEICQAIFPQGLGVEVVQEISESIVSLNQSEILPDSISNQTFEEQVAEILNQMAEKIFTLQNRVDDLQETLNEQTKSRNTVDLSYTMSRVASIGNYDSGVASFPCNFGPENPRVARQEEP